MCSRCVCWAVVYVGVFTNTSNRQGRHVKDWQEDTHYMVVKQLLYCRLNVLLIGNA